MNTTADKRLIDTLIATVQRTSPDLVEVRFKPGAVLTISGITAVLRAREELGRTASHCALIVFPEEETDFDMSMITMDHYKGRPVVEFTQAVAWVVRNEHNERFTRLYFAYFPSPVPSAIFMEEAEARAWLAK
ncbi:MAG: hypothetical protein IPG10_02650 [Flavobacteriales bacterium]|nr:hypothetical protein [Flavobacteriales bacterium]MBK6753802.1 hypothetical protein [Flavobacteriales bacterium]MBK7751055.1 hypothetical protein [Flavobacteriales bacterium]MBK9074783.1 hypothetical protein [Flavobacteriales bacterium]MBK9539080.1 hypothetical protein [Flavobacteriales bacterium]